MYSIIQLFPNLPRSIQRDLPRCKTPARPAGTSLNLNLILNLILNLNLMSLVYSIIHVFYYSCILLFMYSIIHVFYYSIIPQPPPLDPAGLAALQIPRPTHRNFAQPQPQPPIIRVFNYSCTLLFNYSFPSTLT